MTYHIAADADTLMRQAPGTAAVYLRAAVDNIDSVFGEGYAEANPELVGAFIQAAAIDMAGATIAQQLRAGQETIAEAIEGVDCEPLAEAVGGLSIACEDVGKAIAIHG